jgi:hypothetical protein
MGSELGALAVPRNVEALLEVFDVLVETGGQTRTVARASRPIAGLAALGSSEAKVDEDASKRRIFGGHAAASAAVVLTAPGPVVLGGAR